MAALRTDLYKDVNISQCYTKFRPRHPPEVYDAIERFCDKGGTGQHMALDVACGPGITTQALVPHFEKVSGVDISETQIEEAKRQHPDLTFHVGRAEDLSFQPDSSVDLVTCAQAYHYLDKLKFHTEVDRILKPNGVLAIYSYDTEWKFNKEEMTIYLKKNWCDRMAKSDFKEQKELMNHYRDCPPLPWTEVERHEDMGMTMTGSVSEFLGFLESAKGVQVALLGTEARETFMADLREKLKFLYTNTDGSESLVQFTATEILILGRKPGL